MDYIKKQYRHKSFADGDTFINVIEVKKSYHRGDMEIPILNGIDLTIRPGEFLAMPVCIPQIRLTG